MINLIRLDGQEAITPAPIRTTRTVKRERSRAVVMPSMQVQLMKYLDLSEKDAEKICEKYGEYGGAVDYLCGRLGMTRDEAFEKGIVPYPKPKDKCDETHKAVLDEYRRIRLEKGIKAANDYFSEANDMLL